MPRAGSPHQGSARSRIAAWLRENPQYLFLLLLDLVFFSAWSAVTGIAPAGDLRAHIFRTLDFVQGLSAGDYTPIQYHGYAFLAGYGVGFYAMTWALYSFFALFVAGFQAATIACNLAWVMTPFVLAVSALALADELGMRGSNHRRIMQALLGATILLLPGGTVNLSGASPYILSFAFSLMAFVYGLRTGKEPRAIFGLLAFSALSIYTENYGYFFMGTVFLGLIAIRRPVLKVLPVLAAISAFSWVQLLEVSGYTSPYIEEVPVLSIGFLSLSAIAALVLCAFSLFVFAVRDSIDGRHRAFYVVLILTALATFAAVAKGSFGWDFYIFNGLVDNILPWRFLFVNLPVLLLVFVYALCQGNIRSPGLSKALAVASIFLIATPVALGTYPVAFDPLPPAGHYEQFSGARLLVAGPALTNPASPVTYSPAFDFTTVSGPFGQGDPSFFSLTVYYEWSQYFIDNGMVATNFLHLTGADQLVTSLGGGPISLNSSGSSYSEAVAVTPILLEAQNSTEALKFALFVNLLGKDGFMLDFVTDVPPGEVYGAVVLPGYQGTTPVGVPVYSVDNAPQVRAFSSMPIVPPFITSPFDPFGPPSNASMDLASSISTSLISFFHPTYAPVRFTQGPSYYSASSNSSLPIQLAVSYYPYFSPANYSQNVYHFILLPGSGTISWHLPFYEVAAAVSILASAGAAVLGWISVRRSRAGKAGGPGGN